MNDLFQLQNVYQKGKWPSKPAMRTQELTTFYAQDILFRSKNGDIKANSNYSLTPKDTPCLPVPIVTKLCASFGAIQYF